MVYRGYTNKNLYKINNNNIHNIVFWNHRRIETLLKNKTAVIAVDGP